MQKNFFFSCEKKAPKNKRRRIEKNNQYAKINQALHLYNVVGRFREMSSKFKRIFSVIIIVEPSAMFSQRLGLALRVDQTPHSIEELVTVKIKVTGSIHFRTFCHFIS